MKRQYPRLSFVDDAKTSIRNIVSVTNDVLSQLQGDLLYVPLSQRVPVTAPTTADTAFIVRHSLGEKPVFFSWMARANVTCYATTDDLTEWSDRQIKIRCSAPNEALIIRVEAE